MGLILFKVFSSGGRFVQSGTVRAVLVDGLCRNICEILFKILVSGFEDVV